MPITSFTRLESSPKKSATKNYRGFQPFPKSTISIAARCCDRSFFGDSSVEPPVAVNAKSDRSWQRGFAELHFVAEVLTNRWNPKTIETLNLKKFPKHERCPPTNDPKLLYRFVTGLASDLCIAGHEQLFGSLASRTEAHAFPFDLSELTTTFTRG